MASLYLVANQYKQIESRLMESDLDEQTIKDTLESVAGDLEQKCTAVATVIKNMDAFIEQMKDAKRELDERIKAFESRSERINNYLLDNMKKTGIIKIESPYFTIALRTNPPSVIIEDEGEIEGKYWKQKTVSTIDKLRIKEALQNGEDVPGAKLIAGERVDIK